MIAQNRGDINEDGVIKSANGKDSFFAVGNGNLISVLNPKPEDIDINTIASSLAKQCRFNGHCSRMYTVAEHSVRGTNIAYKDYGPSVAREFLLHDATEAYLGDMIRPLKRLIPMFSEIEQGFWGAISQRFNLPYIHSAEVHDIDNIMVTWEKRDLMPNSGHWPGLPDISNMNLPDISNDHVNDWEYTFLLYFKTFFPEESERVNA